MKKLEVKPGDNFGKWTIIKEVSPIIISGKPRRMFKCKCECGNEKEVQLHCLRNGHSTSCGCNQKQIVSKLRTTHGLSDKHPLYLTWKNMKKRCNNPKASEYENYGGRGISVCDEWSKSFESFYLWSINNGWEKELSIDRIDLDGNYCPENCRWATRTVQMNNTRRNHCVMYNGNKYTLLTLSAHLNIPYNIVRYRIAICGFTPEQLISYYYGRIKNKEG